VVVDPEFSVLQQVVMSRAVLQNLGRGVIAAQAMRSGLADSCGLTVDQPAARMGQLLLPFFLCQQALCWLPWCGGWEDSVDVVFGFLYQ